MNYWTKGELLDGCKVVIVRWTKMWCPMPVVEWVDDFAHACGSGRLDNPRFFFFGER